jgi:hypothetical protein
MFLFVMGQRFWFVVSKVWGFNGAKLLGLETENKPNPYTKIQEEPHTHLQAAYKEFSMFICC